MIHSINCNLVHFSVIIWVIFRETVSYYLDHLLEFLYVVNHLKIKMMFSWPNLDSILNHLTFWALMLSLNSYSLNDQTMNWWRKRVFSMCDQTLLTELVEGLIIGKIIEYLYRTRIGDYQRYKVKPWPHKSFVLNPLIVLLLSFLIVVISLLWIKHCFRQSK
jgi:hypothetical protein